MVQAIRGPSEQLQHVAHLLDRERLALSIAAAFDEADIPCVLLKGPSFTRWLYRPGEPRISTDIDFLVPAGTRLSAEQVLARLGFSSHLFGLDQIRNDRSMPSREWTRPEDGATVDLHQSLLGLRCSPRRAWEVLSAHTESMPVLDSELTVFDVGGRAFHAAAHAAQFPTEQAKEDLRRAIAIAHVSVWRDAEQIASDLDALDWFAEGLRQVSQGRELARTLRLPEEVTIETALLRNSAPSTSLFLNQLKTLPTMREKLTLVAGKVAPPVSFMRSWSPRASRGRWGLTVSYVTRPFILLSRLPRGFIELRRASQVGRGEM